MHLYLESSSKQRWHPNSPYGPADVSAQPGYQPPVITSSYVSANSLYDPQTGETLIQIDPNILFEFSKWDIRQSTASDVVMGQIADAIRQAGRLTTLSAHTDFVDEQHFNFNLAQKRANMPINCASHVFRSLIAPIALFFRKWIKNCTIHAFIFSSPRMLIFLLPSQSSHKIWKKANNRLSKK